MNHKEILKHNNKMISKCDLLDNMNTFNITKNEIYNKITEFKIDKYYYNKNRIIKDKTIYKILLNRNINNIDDNIKKGIVSKKSNLRILPTKISFYNKKKDKIFDRLQETVLNIGTTLYILNTSLDKKWYFVKSYFAYGWINKNDFIFVDNNKFNYFENTDNFIIVTKPLIKIKGLYFEMGTKLPYIKNNINKTKILLPNSKCIWIPNKYLSLGYIDYTYDNLIKLTNKYIDFKYGWGGLNNGIDCTSLVCNIFKCFGFTFPRNTREQRKIVGTKTFSFHNLNKNDKIELLKNFGLLYTKDHCLIYIGNNEVIHAYSENKKVIKSNLDNTNGKDLYNDLIYYNIFRR